MMGSFPEQREPGPLAMRMEARLQEQLGGYALTPDFDWVAWLQARLGHAGHFIYLAEQEGQPVGYVYGRLRAPPAPPARRLAQFHPRALLRRLRRRPTGPAASASFVGWGVIESIFVTASVRRQGVARRLVAAVQAELARHAVGRIEISVMANNEAALALWTRLGFQPFREHRVKVLSPADQALAEANR